MRAFLALMAGLFALVIFTGALVTVGPVVQKDEHNGITTATADTLQAP